MPCSRPDVLLLFVCCAQPSNPLNLDQPNTMYRCWASLLLRRPRFPRAHQWSIYSRCTYSAKSQQVVEFGKRTTITSVGATSRARLDLPAHVRVHQVSAGYGCTAAVASDRVSMIGLRGFKSDFFWAEATSAFHSAFRSSSTLRGGRQRVWPAGQVFHAFANHLKLRTSGLYLTLSVHCDVCRSGRLGCQRDVYGTYDVSLYVCLIS